MDIDIWSTPPKKRKQKAKIGVSFKLSSELTEKLDKLAHKNGRSVAGYLEFIISDALRKMND